MLRNLGEHWWILLLVVILLFGSKRLPDAARGLGRSMRILKSETKALSEDGAAPPMATAVADDSVASVAAPPQPPVASASVPTPPPPPVPSATPSPALAPPTGEPVRVNGPVNAPNA